MRVADRIVSLPRVVAHRMGMVFSVAVLATSTACLDLKPPSACTISVAPQSLTLPVNGAATIVGTAFNCDGNSIRNKRINFSSSNNAVATVTTEGAVIAVSVGTATISAVADGKSASVPVTVTPEQAATVTVTPGNLTLRRTNTRQLTAVARNAQTVIIAGRTFRWGSSNSAIAAVDQNGMVTALAPGNVVISAESDQTTGTANLVVTEIPIGASQLSPANTRITVGQQTQPTITLRDTAGNILPTLGRQIAWSSDNEVAATVSGSGLVTARLAGTARITASPVENPQAASVATVDVVDARIVTARITPTNGSLRLGVPRQFQRVLTDSVGGTISANRIVSWTSVTPSIATVNSTGLVTGLALGTARIAINAEGAVDTLTMQVTRIPVATVRLSPASNVVVQGGTVQLTATVEDSVGSTVTDRAIEWTSSDANRAIVSGSGLVSTFAPGQVTITATSEIRSGTASVTIQQTPADSVLAVNATFPANQASKTITYRVVDAAGNELPNRDVFVSVIEGSLTTTTNASQQSITVLSNAAGSAVLSIRARSAVGQPEGKTTRITVTITP
jgi:uncharacterized protein YjdB